MRTLSTFPVAFVSQETFLTILSKCGQQQRVDDMLDSLEEGPPLCLPSLVASVAYKAFPSLELASLCHELPIFLGSDTIRIPRNPN